MTPFSKYNFFKCTVLGLLLTANQLQAQTNADRQRYVGLMNLNLNGTLDAADNYTKTAINNGCNLVYMTIFWDRVYTSSTSQPDWRQYDRQIEMITQMGAKVAIRIWVGRNRDRINGYWTEKESQQDANFKPIVGIYDATMFSYNYQPAVDKAQEFIKQVCQRYNRYQTNGQILFVTVATTPTQEIGYQYENWPDGNYDKRSGNAFDYSKSATDAFNDWIQQKYKRLAKLNYVWKSNPVTAWDQASPIPLPEAPKATFSGRRGRDWYYFRHQTLKKFIDQTVSTIRGVNSTYKIINDYGSVIDNLSALRGTLAFKDLDQNVNGTKVNNSTDDNHYLIIDVLRSNSNGRWTMNEVFYDGVATTADYIRQFDECFEFGSNIVVFTISTDAQMEGSKATLRAMSNKWLNVPVADIKPQVSMKYSVTQLLDSTNAAIYKEYEQKTNVPGGGKRPVNIELIEDILLPSYWDVLINVPPVVNYALGNRASRLRRDFVYKIPNDLFKDPDGSIVKIEAVDLPSWLRFNNGEFSGVTPSQIADYTIVVRATDDDGATIQTSFNLKTVDINQVPIVNYSLADRTSKPNRAFSYKIQADLFRDSDGTITKVEAVNLPSWLKFENNDLSGTTPTALGEYTITIRATDDDGATAQTNFKIKILDTNIRPVAAVALPNFDTYRQQSVEFKLRDDQFEDADGRIVRIEARNLKPWMRFDGKTFFAYPDELGTFKVTLRAIDDDSAFVESSFQVRVVNRIPIVTKPFGDKIVALSKVFKYKVSKDNFTDLDGSIVRVAVFGRPSWIQYDNDELSGTPTQLGTFRLTVRAYDTTGDSVETALNIIVDTRQNLNSPPVVRFQIPNVKMFANQPFKYKISDSLFYDANGYIDRVETPNLPNWLSFKNNELIGIPTQEGSYTVTIKATDDDETSVTTTFRIDVRFPAFTLELQQAGTPAFRKFIAEIKNNDIIQATSLPDKINLYATCESPFNKITFNLSGPYRKSLTVNKFPYTLFNEETGFGPVAGAYTLQMQAFKDSLKVSESTVRFRIQTDKPLTDWQVYPNPFDQVCNIKILDNLVATDLTYNLITLTGQKINISKNNINTSEQVIYLDLGGASLSTGMYFVEIFKDQERLKIVKIIKQ
jgi:Putative Ig domain/Beta-galactosidase/Secretion system C-terminal sorting domain